MKNTYFKISALLLGIIAPFLSAFFIVRSQAQNMPGEVVPVTQSQIDAWFTTGSMPTQFDYWSTYDTLFYYIAATYSNSLAAAQSAAHVESVFDARLEGGFGIPAVPGYIPTNGIYSSVNFTNCVAYHIGSSDAYLSNNFITPFPDANYIVDVKVNNYPGDAAPWTIIQKTQTNLVFDVIAGNLIMAPPTNYVITLYR